jgi:hypothetical protein
LKISREERWLRSRIQIHRVHVSTLKDPKYSKDKAYTRVETPAPVTYSTPRADAETMEILDETEELDENFRVLKFCASEPRSSRSESEQLASDLDYDHQMGQNMLQLADNPLLTTDGVETSDHGFSQSTMVHEQNTPANDEQQGAINISSPQREREGKVTAVRCSVLFPGHVSKQLDRFIAENDIHENEQMAWESIAGRELLFYQCIKIIKSDQHTQLFPRRLLMSLLKNLKVPRMGGRKA